jgi:hypothetical protein
MFLLCSFQLIQHHIFEFQKTSTKNVLYVQKEYISVFFRTRVSCSGPLPIPKKPWSLISMDFITDLSSSKAFDSIFVVVDRLTKMVHFMPCNKTVTGEETAILFMDNIYKYHGFPDDIISDHVHNSPRSFGNHYSRSLRPRSSCLPCIILRLMDKPNGLIKSWNNIYIVPSITIKIIGRSCYHLPSLRTTTPSKDLLSRPCSLPTMDTIQSSISSTSTKWKIQQPETLLFNCLRFIRR